MINCQICEHNPKGERCELFGRVIGMHGCSSGVERKPKNNFEMLKNMSMEELAKWLVRVAGCRDGLTSENAIKLCTKIIHCDACWLEWLKEEIADA